jgi:hypothetical protein
MTYKVVGLDPEYDSVAHRLFEGKYVVPTVLPGSMTDNTPQYLRIKHALHIDEQSLISWCARAGWTLERKYLVPIGDL